MVRLYAVIVICFLLYLAGLGALLSTFYRTQGPPRVFAISFVEVRHLETRACLWFLTRVSRKGLGFEYVYKGSE